MRALLSSLAFAALLGGTSLALAEGVSGKIKSVDHDKRSVTLEDGSTYMAPMTVKLSDFKVGDKVSLNYTKSGDKMDLTSIEPEG